MVDLLVILQNPYKKGELCKGWSRKRWEKEFATSHTHTRLMEAIPEGINYCVTNASRVLADTPDEVMDADIPHLRRQINYHAPRVILACGRIAQAAIDFIRPNVPVVKMYHPAYRALSKKLTTRAHDNVLRLLGTK